MVTADPAGCGDLFDPVGGRVFTAVPATWLAQCPDRLVGELFKMDRRGSGSLAKVVVNGKDGPYSVNGSRSTARPSRQSSAAGYPKAGHAQIVKMSNPFAIFRPQSTRR